MTHTLAIGLVPLRARSSNAIGRLLTALAGLTVFALATLLSASDSARAGTPVLALHVDGEKVPSKDRTDLHAALEARLRLYPNLEVKTGPQGDVTDEMIDLECIDLDTSCLAKLGTKYKAERVIHVALNPKAGVIFMKVRIIDAKTGAALRENEVKAAHAIELAPALEAEIDAVFGKPPEVKKKGFLVVEASSPEAQIQLGTEYMGTGNATAELSVGEYTIRVSLQGFQDVIRKVVVKEGQTTAEPVKLVPLVTTPPVGKEKKKDEPTASGAWWPWVLVGAAVVGGAIAIIAVTSGSGDDTVRGPAILSIDGSAAWRDGATIGGRP
jgi:hypothetical protein